MGVTIKDIAKIAGVSHTTVSRSLNDSPLIKDSTKEKIKKIAGELDYVPDRNARGLRRAKSDNIGLFFSSLVEGTSSSFLKDIVSGISDVIPDSYNLVINALDKYDDYKSIDKRNYDGIILVSQTEKDDEFIKEMLENEIPLVVINREVKDLDVINILSDDLAGVYDGISYLINKKHREIGFIEGLEGFVSSELRKKAYIKALENHQIDFVKKYIVPGDYTIDGGYKAMVKLLNLDKYPSAVFCSNDDMAFGAVKAIHELGLEIPKDIAIMGFDDSLFAKYMTPPLTTIKRPIKEISIEGIRLLLKLMKKEEISKKKIYKFNTLINRQSV